MSKVGLGHKPTVFEDTYLRFIKEARERGLVTLDELQELVELLRKYKMDCHVVFAGQNGVGKSMVLLAFLKKCLGKKWFNNLVLAKHTMNYIIQFILHNADTICCVDEWNQYLNYARHAEADQKHFITTLELARSKSIGFIGCARDPRKLTLNYRDGKMSIVVWVVDRFTDGGSYAGVFVTNPVIESFDKFGFSQIPGDIVDFDELRYVFENLPSFVGWLNMDDVHNHVTKKELDHYEKEKDMAIAYAHLNHVVEQYRKKKIDREELLSELDRLRDLLPEEDIAKAIPARQTKISKYFE